MPEFSERTLPVDTAVARRCARLHVSNKRGARCNDPRDCPCAWHEALVIRNVDDYMPTGVPLINPWGVSK